MADQQQWTEDLPEGLIVIGAVAGSGTRVIVRTLELAGVFMGYGLSPAGESGPLVDYVTRWINPYVSIRQDPVVGPPLEIAMRADLVRVLREHLAPLSCLQPRGFKQPRSIVLLPFLEKHLRGLRFVHLLRDGRDMVFSAHHSLLRAHGRVLLTEPERRLSAWQQSMLLWARVNLAAADFACEHMAGRYLALRFEDLCEEPERTVSRLFEFLSLQADAAVVARQTVHSPISIGRHRRVPGLRALGGRMREAFGSWRHESGTWSSTLKEIESAGARALERFGYGRDGPRGGN